MKNKLISKILFFTKNPNPNLTKFLSSIFTNHSFIHNNQTLNPSSTDQQNPISETDVLGVELPQSKQSELQNFIYNALRLKNPKLYFPGSQPVSMDKSNLQFLRRRKYNVTWKADGTRYLMIINNQGCHLIDRKFTVRKIENPQILPSTPNQTPTILDGEMVIDTLSTPRGAVKKRNFLAYDLIMLKGKPIIKMPFSKRWEILGQELSNWGVNPKSPKSPENPNPQFNVLRKMFWDLNESRKILKHVIPNSLTHESDGLIFQCCDDPYIPRTNPNLLKWKIDQTVDFLFVIDELKNHNLYLMDGERMRRLEGSRLVFKEDLDLVGFDGKILECGWKKEEGFWVFFRVRVDKERPNSWGVYEKIRKSLEDEIGEEFLLREIDEIVKLPIYVNPIQS